ncbi:glycosyltransferase family 15 protein [Pluteus cervinus]|uniref:Glycosyltransferase family 15 protein n=1 Tax=Pluteus cervinus TaxID=181527 RepID=A0ACD3A525_9AGAR|nr:glycosyltransferase family 15 protein [Pluteus cervinus]
MLKPSRLIFAVVVFLGFISVLYHYNSFKPLLSGDESNTSSSLSDLDGFPQDTNPTLPDEPAPQRANATLFMLARNSDITGVVNSIKQLERRFNHKFHYPYVFLNNVPFTKTFKQRVLELTDSTVEFGLIPREHWIQPDWIDEEKAYRARQRMKSLGVLYGESLSYRNMCRFNSGFFFKHELMQKYRWYWRVEPDVKFFCDIPQDPFVFMEEHDKVYGFTITAYELRATIPTLWSQVQRFIEDRPELIASDNAMDFISSPHGLQYSACHFWSNFEIADMDFWRGPAYTAFFEHLDLAGGFYYERWGDAPVHSIGVSLLARKDQVHFFDEIGYQHENWMHCPTSSQAWADNKCTCNPLTTFDKAAGSCLTRWENTMTGQQ